MAVDYGHKRIGLAVGDTVAALASPLEVFPGGDDAQAVRRLKKVVEEYGCGGIVVGLPLNMDDTLGPQGKLSVEFALKINDEIDVDVRMWDERLSSFSADELLAGTMTRKKRKARQDAVAAASFLNDFLSSGGPEKAPTPKQVLSNE